MHDFVPLAIADVARETADAVVLQLIVPPTLADAFKFRPGQHLAFRTTLDGEELRRTYSICSGPDDDHLAVAIKRIADGRFSSWACATLRPGMTLEAMPPAGRFVLADPAGDRRHILAFAAGAGITPIMAMAEHTMRRHPDTRFTLVYGNRDIDSIIFRQRLEDLKDAHLDRFTLVHILSRNAESETPVLEGRITADKVAALSPHLFPASDVDQTYLCGPGSMIRDVRNALFALNFPRDRVHHEFFAAGGGAYRSAQSAHLSARSEAPIVPTQQASSPSPETTATAPETEVVTEVVAVIDGQRRSFTAAPGEALVDAALRAGVRAPYACKGGMCSTCRARIVEGQATMRVNYSLEPWELEQGFILTCQAIAQTPRIVIDYDQM